VPHDQAYSFQGRDAVLCGAYLYQVFLKNLPIPSSRYKGQSLSSTLTTEALVYSEIFVLTYNFIIAFYHLHSCSLKTGSTETLVNTYKFVP
jgi:hypothetical protein